MAQKVKEGVDSVEGCEGVLYQVPETLPGEVLKKMGVPPKDTDVPIITAEELVNADGILFGIPTRFGMAAAQMKSFMDSTGSLWQGGKLMGKPAGVFISTASQVRPSSSKVACFYCICFFDLQMRCMPVRMIR